MHKVYLSQLVQVSLTSVELSDMLQVQLSGLPDQALHLCSFAAHVFHLSCMLCLLCFKLLLHLHQVHSSGLASEFNLTRTGLQIVLSVKHTAAF